MIRWIVIFTALSAAAWAEQGWEICAEKARLFERLAAENAADGKGFKYAPDRRIDVKHLKLDITPDFEKRSLRGKTTLTFAPIGKPLREVKLDAVDLTIESVTSNRPLESYHLGSDALSLLFTETIPVGEQTSVTIDYHAEPQEGLYFRTPEMGYKEGDTHLWTQGEPEKHRHWFPGYDYPNERFSTEVVCRVPEGMIVLSNGKLLSEKKVQNGLTEFHWLQEKPHVNYLISVVAGYFKGLEDQYEDVPLAFYTPPSDFPQAANSFVDTREILDFFEDEIGVPYPWHKYYNVCVQDFIAGGMENTSVTTLTTRTLFSEASENIRTTRHLDAHEVAHQWFGNLVTCKDWTHLWLNEGFATYYTELYEGHKFDRDHMLYGMYRNAGRVLSQKDKRPIAWRKYENPWQQFDYRAYPKGAWVLHMLRSQLGEELYRECIRTYLERHRNGVVVTADLNAAVEDVSGRTFDRFFDQWVFHGGHPRLSVEYSWDAKLKQAKLVVSQKQEVSEEVMLFQFPLPVRFHLEDGAYDATISITQESEEFYFDLKGAPRVVRIDPDYSVLAEVDVKLPKALLETQVELESDMMGRLFAVKQLTKRKDSKALELLESRLKNDSFFGVRIEAAKALKAIQKPEALTVLIDNRNQEDARVKQEVVQAVSSYYRPEAQEALLQVAESESNPDIVASALEGLGKFPGEAIEKAILAALDRESFRHQIAMAAIESMRKQDQFLYAKPLLTHLQARKDAFDARDFGNALKVLGYLARNEELSDREPYRIYIASHLSDPRQLLRVPVIEALTLLGDPSSIALLEPLMNAEGPAEREAKAAQEAVKDLSANRKQATEVTDLRNEVLNLQSDIVKLREDMERMRKRFDAEKEKEGADGNTAN